MTSGLPGDLYDSMLSTRWIFRPSVNLAESQVCRTQTRSWEKRESRISYLVGILHKHLGERTMPMVKKSISVTAQQDRWIKAQIDTGHFGNESEVVRELIRERQMQQQETPEEIAAIRAALIEGEQSGFSSRSVDEIWEEARARHKTKKHA